MDKEIVSEKNEGVTLGKDYALMTEADVEREIGKHRRTLIRWASEGKFPKPIELGERSRGWLKKEIEAWVAERVSKRSA